MLSTALSTYIGRSCLKSSEVIASGRFLKRYMRYQEGNKLVRLDEKPFQRCFVNGGIYVCQPDMIDLIPNDEYFDMTHLFDKMMEKDYKSVIYQIREYWMDAGHKKDFETADGEYGEIFWG